MSQKTVAELIREGTDILDKAGVVDARHDAWALMKAIQPNALGPLAEQHISNYQATAFLALIQRRAGREPLQHILGEASIYELTLKSDARALIPRQDSAEAITLAIESLTKLALSSPIIADLGTGSGVLLAEVMHRFERAQGIAIERDVSALSLAQENFETLGMSDRIDVFEGSWATWYGWGDCDLILSNPPYIESAVIPGLQPEVRDFDPMAALDGGADGLDAYREITTLAGAHMKSGAYLVFEIGFDQKDAVSQLLLKAGFTDLRHQQDLGGQDRAIAALKS